MQLSCFLHVFVNCFSVALARRRLEAEFVRQEPISTLDQGQRWGFDCPQLAPLRPYDRLEATWKLDDHVWMHIDDGEIRRANKLSDYARHKIRDRYVLSVAANDFRYMFYYDEHKNRYYMNINGITGPDQGFWECALTVYRYAGNIQHTSSFEKLTISGEGKHRAVKFHLTGRRIEEPIIYERTHLKNKAWRRYRPYRSKASNLCENTLISVWLFVLSHFYFCFHV